MSALDALKSLKIRASSVFPRTPSAPKTQVLSNAGLLHSGNHDSKETGLPLAKPCCTPPTAKGSLLSLFSHSRMNRQSLCVPVPGPTPLAGGEVRVSLPFSSTGLTGSRMELQHAHPPGHTTPAVSRHGPSHPAPLRVLCRKSFLGTPRKQQVQGPENKLDFMQICQGQLLRLQLSKSLMLTRDTCSRWLPPVIYS